MGVPRERHSSRLLSQRKRHLRNRDDRAGHEPAGDGHLSGLQILRPFRCTCSSGIEDRWAKEGGLKSSAKTNAIRKALRYAALCVEEESHLSGVTSPGGRSVNYSPAVCEAMQAIAIELRERASGHRGKKVK